MPGAVTAAGVGVAAALCCLTIPLTAGIIGLSGLAAFGANVGIVAIVVSALVAAWIIRTRSRDEADVSEDGDR